MTAWPDPFCSERRAKPYPDAGKCLGSRTRRGSAASDRRQARVRRGTSCPSRQRRRHTELWPATPQPRSFSDAGPRAAGDLPGGFQVTDWWSYFGAGMKPLDLAKIRELARVDPAANQGWSQTGRKQNPVHRHLHLERIRAGRGVRAYSIIEVVRSLNGNGKRYDLTVDWSDWAPDGTLLFGQAGRLYRQGMPRSLAGPLEPSRLIADLTGQSFEHIVA